MMVGPRRSCRRRLDLRHLDSVASIAGRKRKYARNRNEVHRSHSEFSFEQRKKWRRTSKRLRRSNSVIFVSEVPCCCSENKLKKYKRLGLNTALFLSGSSRPRRKQSHVSIITISSDDEGINTDRTAEWVASVNEMTIGPEAAETKTDALSGSNRDDQDKISQDLSQQISGLHFSSTLERSESFNPLCVSTPQTSPTSCQPFGSFLTNPLNTNLHTFTFRSKNNETIRIEKNNEKSTNQNLTPHNGFYFGSSAESRNTQSASHRCVDYNFTNLFFNRDFNNNDTNQQNEEPNNTENNSTSQR